MNCGCLLVPEGVIRVPEHCTKLENVELRSDQEYLSPGCLVLLSNRQNVYMYGFNI